MKVRQRLSLLWSGFRSVATVIFTNKDIVTEFNPSPTSSNTQTEDEQSETAISLSHIPEENTLEIEPTNLNKLKEFITNYHILDSVSVPCIYNASPCEAEMSVFPRIMRPVNERPFIAHIISLAINDGTYIARAEYNTTNPNVINAFEADIAKMKPRSHDVHAYDSDERRTDNLSRFNRLFPNIHAETNHNRLPEDYDRQGTQE